MVVVILQDLQNLHTVKDVDLAIRRTLLVMVVGSGKKDETNISSVKPTRNERMLPLMVVAGIGRKDETKSSSVELTMKEKCCS